MKGVEAAVHDTRRRTGAAFEGSTTAPRRSGTIAPLLPNQAKTVSKRYPTNRLNTKVAMRMRPKSPYWSRVFPQTSLPTWEVFKILSMF